MRKIKFRGFCKDINDWVYGSIVEEFDRTKLDENGKIPDYYQIYSKISGWHIVEKGSIEQYTGYSDINGIDIYEGDKVSFKRWAFTKEILIGRVGFVDGLYCILPKISLLQISLYSRLSDIEVIKGDRILKCEQCYESYFEYMPETSGLKICNKCSPF